MPYPILKMRRTYSNQTGYVIWIVLSPEGTEVGEICKTGESRDNYPWSWEFYNGTPIAGGYNTSFGVADSRRDALDTMSYQWHKQVTEPPA